MEVQLEQFVFKGQKPGKEYGAFYPSPQKCYHLQPGASHPTWQKAIVLVNFFLNKIIKVEALKVAIVLARKAPSFRKANFGQVWDHVRAASSHSPFPASVSLDQ